MVTFKCPSCGHTTCVEYYVRLHHIDIKSFKLDGKPQEYDSDSCVELTDSEMSRTYAPMYDGLTYECGNPECRRQWRDHNDLIKSGAVKATRDRKPKKAE